ncbi:MAG: N-acetyl sugar amidotransferase [Bacteroidetes bacterium]|nr:N-acetyl sugar amidotransferase [Bacteroidota bacterium]
MVVVSGIEKDITYQQCTRCICDNTIPGIGFDDAGVCSLCHMHDSFDAAFPNDARGEKVLQKKFEKIRKDGAGKKYDCVIGISGGRDSIYLLYLAVTKWKVRPLAVHFNDGFDNPVAGENMLKAVRRLGVELRTITSDFRECKDLKITDLKASTPLLNNGTDVGIGASLYGVAYKEGIKHILFGQSFRTEGIRPIAWAYFDGDHLRAVHKIFGKVPLRKWKPDDPGFNLGIKEMFFYTVINGIRVHSPLYNYPYNREEAGEILSRELDWVYPGAHYFDDLYWALITYLHRTKFKINFRLIEYSALIRSGQLDREEAIARAQRPYRIEDPKVISLCIKRLGLTEQEFEQIIQSPPKNWWDYPNSYKWMKLAQGPIYILTKMGIFTQVVYDKYFSIKFR